MANNTIEEENYITLVTTYFICEIVIACLAVVGNSAIIIAFVLHRKLRTIQNCYIVSLAIIDFSMGFFAIPFVLITLDGTRPKSKELCFFMLTIVVLMDLCSVFSVMALTVDRFYAVCWPFKYHANMTYRKTMIYISIAWIVPIAIASLVPLGWNNLDEGGFQDCSFASIVSMVYYAVLYFFCFIPLFVVMCLMYAKVFRIIQSQLKTLAEIQAIGSRLNQQNTSRAVTEQLPRPAYEPPSGMRIGHNRERKDKDELNESGFCESNKCAAEEFEGSPDLNARAAYNEKLGFKISFEGAKYDVNNISDINARILKKTGNERNGHITDTLATVSTTFDKEEIPVPDNQLIGYLRVRGTQTAEVENNCNRTNEESQNDDRTFFSNDPVEKTYQRFHRIRGERRTAILFLFIMVFLFISWSPIYIIDVFLAFEADVNQSLINFAVLLSHFNSAVNPILYGYKSEFRCVFKGWALGISNWFYKICRKNRVVPDAPTRGASHAY